MALTTRDEGDEGEIGENALRGGMMEEEVAVAGERRLNDER